MPNPDDPPAPENEGPTREYPRVVSREPVVGDQPIEYPRCVRCGGDVKVCCRVVIHAPPRYIHGVDFCSACADETVRFVSRKKKE